MGKVGACLGVCALRSINVFKVKRRLFRLKITFYKKWLFRLKIT
jgi:hypothetical protein